jgi:hypothetical protein
MKAWTIWSCSLVVVLATLVLIALGAGHSTPADSFGFSGYGGVAFAVPTLAFATVGALIVARVPGNPLGPIFCVTGLALGIGDLNFQYADQGLYIASDRLPGAVIAAWLPFGVPPSVGLLAIAVLIFPDGRLPSRRWLPALWLAVAGIGANVVGYALRPGPLDEPFAGVANPIGVEGTFDLMDALSGLSWILMGAAVGLAALATSRRLRRARGVERQQLKWLALAAAISGAAVVSDVLSYFVRETGFEDVRVTVLGLGFAAFPVAAGAAILRYRLFDIDVVINRTLVYGALTATLGGTYLGLVLLIGLTVGQSDVAIAISTLAVAALFRPARARIQGAVDRRFYRRRYDAQRTLDVFGARLRDEVDLEAVGAELGAAVRDTVQPAHLSLWLASERRTR